MPLVRLDKIITDTGLCSRRNAKERIREGLVTVDGRTVTDPAAKFDPAQTHIEVAGDFASQPKDAR